MFKFNHNGSTAAPAAAAVARTPLPAGRVPWVDIAKGICIILVVMMHTTLGLEKAAGVTGWMHYLVEFAKPFRMPDFFLISGLFLAATINRPWRLYLDRKVVHFFYFYCLWVIIQLAVKTPFKLAEGYTLMEMGGTLILSTIQPFGTLWFIYMLPVFFVVTKFFKAYPWHLFAAAVVLQMLPINTSFFWPQIVGQLGFISVDDHWVLIDEFCSFYVYFLAGYLFAPRIFALAEWVQNHIGPAILGLAAWVLTNLTLVVLNLAHLPLISLALGGAGAVAIVTMASLLTQLKPGKALNYLGAHSIVVYLAFFIPMVLARLAFLKLLPGLDVGTMAAFSTAFAVVAPLIGLALIRTVGFGYFLFYRPRWAIFASKPTDRQAAMQPAE
ncbi:MAG: acyltransferase family protein [Rhizobiaceae bacterium]